jgi:hypothetical protein
LNRLGNEAKSTKKTDTKTNQVIPGYFLNGEKEKEAETLLPVQFDKQEEIQ